MLTPKVANIIPGSPIALERDATNRRTSSRHWEPVTHPSGFTGGAVVAHVVGNMEDEGLKQEGRGHGTIL